MALGIALILCSPAWGVALPTPGTKEVFPKLGAQSDQHLLTTPLPHEVSLLGRCQQGQFIWEQIPGSTPRRLRKCSWKGIAANSVCTNEQVPLGVPEAHMCQDLWETAENAHLRVMHPRGKGGTGIIPQYPSVIR